MFTGIVESLARVQRVVSEPGGKRLALAATWPDDDVRTGDSIAVNGVCLTALRREAPLIEFQVGPETLERTNLGELGPDDRVNLERALLPTTRLSGHFVQGHVDGVGKIERRRPEGQWEWIEFTAPTELTDQMVQKGSVAIDGVSLTLVDVSPGRFSIMLIPHTLAQTTLGFKQPGATINIETDILGKYVFLAVRRTAEKA